MIKSILPARDGYTLVELLIAVTLLGVIAVPVLALFVGSSSWIAGARCRSTALNLCRERIEDLRSAGCGEVIPFYLPAESFPTIENEIQGYPGFQRKTDVSPLQLEWGTDPPFQPQVLMVEVTVSWELRGREQQETLYCYLMAP
ncbi:MAG: type II secretion system protein [Bacillota bacterium]|nr:type II secretion system protein [Bacillota bacterium]